MMAFTVILSLFLIGYTYCTEFIYHVEEEQASNLLISNVAQDSNLPNVVSSTVYSTLDYSFVKPGSENFRINSTTSDILTRKRIDREKLCQSRELCYEDLSVAVRSMRGAFFKIISVRIYIDDVNDNAPVFSRNSVTKTISEGATSTQSFPLISAVDKDSGINTIQQVFIETEHVPFSVSFERNLDGRVDVSLKVSQSLDRELVDFFSFQVTAVDGGSPQKTSTLDVSVKISDINDIKPTFIESKYNASLAEDTPPGTFVVKVSATDLDLGADGEIHYRFAAHQSGDINNIFSINETNGEIHTLEQLTHHHDDPYNIIVQAIDGGDPPLSGQTIVSVSILDTTNDPPVIEVNLLSDSGKARISEFAGVGTVVVFLNVIDDDPGRNGLVSCEVTDLNFVIQKLDGTGYKIILSRSLDRETNTGYNITVVCQDSGVVPLSSSVSINIEVIDENDHSPVFSQSMFSVSMDENNESGKFIVQVTAHDEDKGHNGNITYSLAPLNRTKFYINPRNGQIAAMGMMDHEMEPHVRLIAYATDGGVPQLSATTVIKIDILDLNDNEPKFEKSVYIFNISENMPTDYSVGRLEATDKDNGRNGAIVYSLSDPYHSTFPFVVFDNGIIKTNRELDREDQSFYRFRVKASDQGLIRYSGTAIVIINVLDKNDNDPMFLFPKNFNRTIPMRNDTLPGTVITVLRAFDADEGQESHLIYTLESVSTLVNMSHKGEITLMRNISDVDIGIHTIIVAVSDNGEPQRTKRTQLDLKVFAKNSTLAWYKKKKEDEKDYAIVAIVLTVITVAIAAVIITIIIVIRTYDHCSAKRASANPNKNIGPATKVPLDDKTSVSVMEKGRGHKSNYLILKDTPDANSSMDSGKGTSASDLPSQTFLNDSTVKSEESASNQSSPIDTKYKAVNMHRALLESHGIQWQTRNVDQDKVRKFLEAVELANQDYEGSESSGENVSDSGRGCSSEEDSSSNSDASQGTDSIHDPLSRQSHKDKRLAGAAYYDPKEQENFQRSRSFGANKCQTKPDGSNSNSKRVHFSNSSCRNLRTFRTDRPPSETMEDNSEVQHSPNKTFNFTNTLQRTTYYDSHGVPFTGPNTLSTFQNKNNMQEAEPKVFLTESPSYLQHVDV